MAAVLLGRRRVAAFDDDARSSRVENRDWSTRLHCGGHTLAIRDLAICRRRPREVAE